MLRPLVTLRARYGKGLGIGANKKTVAKAFAKQRLVPNGERLLDFLASGRVPLNSLSRILIAKSHFKMRQ